MLIVADKAKVPEATKYVNQMMAAIYGANNSQIPDEAKVLGIDKPKIESKEQTQARANPVSRQGSAWGAIFKSDYETTGGSRMKNMAKPRRGGVRKTVELSFDPESKDDFPELKSSKKDTEEAKSSKSSKASKTSKKSESSSDNDTISAVTKEDFHLLGNNLRDMIRSETQSVLSSGTDVTMISLLRDELAASREQSQAQMKMMAEQMTMFQSMMKTMLPNTSNTNEPTTKNQNETESKESDSIESATPSDDTVQTQTTFREEKRKTRSTTKEANEYTVPKYKHDQSIVDEAITQSPSRVDVSNNDEEMNDNTEHKKPKSSGMTPKAKKTKNKHGSNATVLQSRNLEDEFEELQKFHQTTDSEGTVGGES
jgi:hypothetical protein